VKVKLLGGAFSGCTHETSAGPGEAFWVFQGKTYEQYIVAEDGLSAEVNE